MYKVSTKFGVDSLSHFLFRTCTDTNRQTNSRMRRMTERGYCECGLVVILLLVVFNYITLLVILLHVTCRYVALSGDEVHCCSRWRVLVSTARTQHQADTGVIGGVVVGYGRRLPSCRQRYVSYMLLTFYYAFWHSLSNRGIWEFPRELFCVGYFSSQTLPAAIFGHFEAIFSFRLCRPKTAVHQFLLIS